MQQITLRSRVSEDGILHLDIPSEYKGVEVDITVTIKTVTEDFSQLEWHEFLNKTAGSINDESFIRHPQGEYEVRESLE